jgi:hypothetical protein
MSIKKVYERINFVNFVKSLKPEKIMSEAYSKCKQNLPAVKCRGGFRELNTELNTHYKLKEPPD